MPLLNMRVGCKRIKYCVRKPCVADIEMNEDDLDKLVPMVCNMKDIDHNPYKISEDMVYKAFKKLEEYSKIN